MSQAVVNAVIVLGALLMGVGFALVSLPLGFIAAGAELIIGGLFVVDSRG